MFVCEAFAFPEHNVEWIFIESDGTALPIISTADGEDTEKHSVNRNRDPRNGFGVLTVIDVQYEDRGTYSCMAVNDIGEDMAAANLTVHGEFCMKNK